MGVKVNKNCCWVHLKDYDELLLLIQAMKYAEFDGTIVSVEWQELDCLGKRMKVTVQQPGTEPSKQVSYLRGKDYLKWNQIRRVIDAFRKLKGISSDGSN